MYIIRIPVVEHKTPNISGTGEEMKASWLLYWAQTNKHTHARTHTKTHKQTHAHTNAYIYDWMRDNAALSKPAPIHSRLAAFHALWVISFHGRRRVRNLPPPHRPYPQYPPHHIQVACLYRRYWCSQRLTKNAQRRTQTLCHVERQFWQCHVVTRERNQLLWRTSHG